MDIKILGPGCARCDHVEKLVAEVLAAEKIPATIEKIKDVKRFAAYGVFITPALIVDNEVKCAGKIPTKDEVVKWLKK